MNYQFTSRHLTLYKLSWSNQGHITFKRVYLLNGASYQILHETHLTLGGIERSNQGHWVLIWLCIIGNVLLDSGAVRPRCLLLSTHLVVIVIIHEFRSRMNHDNRIRIFQHVREGLTIHAVFQLRYGLIELMGCNQS